jgi:hypothetical protein
MQSRFCDYVCIVTPAPFPSHNYCCVIAILHSHHPIITTHTCIIASMSSHQYTHLHDPTRQLPLHLSSHNHHYIYHYTAIIYSHSVITIVPLLISPDYLFTILHVSAHPYPPASRLFSGHYSNYTSTQPPLPQCFMSPSHCLTFTPSSCLYNSGPAALLSLYSCHRLDLHGCIINR